MANPDVVGDLERVRTEAYVLFHRLMEDHEIASFLQNTYVLMSLEPGAADAGAGDLVTPNDAVAWLHVGGTAEAIEELHQLSGDPVVRQVWPVYTRTPTSALVTRFAPTGRIVGQGLRPILPSSFAWAELPPFADLLYALSPSSPDRSVDPLLSVNPDLELILETAQRLVEDDHDVAVEWLQFHWPFGIRGGVDEEQSDELPWHLQRIDLPKVWAHQRGKPGVTVAVVDSGLDVNMTTAPPTSVHPSLMGSLMPVDTWLKLATDANGKTTATNDVADPLIHGTRTAGVIAASGRGEKKVTGVAPGCRFFPIQIGDPGVTLLAATGQGNTKQVKLGGLEVVLAIEWARKCGARIIHFGIDVDLNPDFRTKTDTAILSAHDAGIVMVAPVGNDLNDKAIAYPASHPAVIGVGASTNPVGVTEDRWTAGQYGSQIGDGLDLVAPGQDIVTTDVKGLVTTTFGATSGAAPHVTGVAALLLSECPQLSPTSVREILLASAEKIADVDGRYSKDELYGRYDCLVGYGLLDALAAFKLARERCGDESWHEDGDPDPDPDPESPPGTRPEQWPDPIEVLRRLLMDSSGSPGSGGSGIIAPMLALIAGYLAGQDSRCGCGKEGGSAGSGTFPQPTVTPRPDAINGLIWHDALANCLYDEAASTAAMGGVVVRLEPLGLQRLTDSQGFYEFHPVPPGQHRLVVPGSTSIAIPQSTASISVDLECGELETVIDHKANHYNRFDFGYR